MTAFTLGSSWIEERAALAGGDSTFGGFNLPKARATLAELLQKIGSTKQFATYTRHDISHIDALLESTNWLIPEDTRSKLSTADALVITLSIYLHDLGMLVTTAEFDERARSDYVDFKAAALADESPRGRALKERIAAHGDDVQEDFLYEEFVRTHHAERIEAWIKGRDFERFGVAGAAVEIVQEVLRDLEPAIKNDIALIARSHHLDDLDNLTKYKRGRRYGNSPEHVVNLQYAALILRTADLLHMTRDRTPLVQFMLTSPTDPMGQLEWRKQQAIRAVTPSESLDGIIEVHALFQEAEGFFALMEFLAYCDGELDKSQRWAALIEESGAVPQFSFPWRGLDKEQVEADGFERRQFSFQLDQEKVLELLTGHTLYNDAGVAVRELVQNSIDAVRLAEFAGDATAQDWDIEVRYESDTRTLLVLDHGVGMTQSQIEKHFLKVGSSGYQSEQFKASHPGFTSISRFGIGVLSAFMIADDLSVTTVTSLDDRGREIRLKSVHGRYLISEVDRDTEQLREIGPHGTAIRLRLRPEAGEQNILALLQRWILVPGCKVGYSEPGASTLRIGHASVGEALRALVEKAYPKEQTRVHVLSSGDSDHAVAQVWNSLYREWEPLLALEEPEEFGYEENDKALSIGGVSIQGIRVTFGSPSFEQGGPVTLSNIVGSNAPRTNVARTDLEQGEALEATVVGVFEAILHSIIGEVDDISSHRSKRLALKEARHMFADSFSNRSRVRSRKALASVLAVQPLHAVEISGEVTALSAEDLRTTGFSVLAGPAADDAARFLDWLPRPKGVLGLLQDGGLLSELPQESRPLLAGQEGLTAYHSLLQERFEPAEIRAVEGDSSVLLTYEAGADRWIFEQAYSRITSKAYNTIMEQISRSAERRLFSSRSLNMFARNGAVQFTDIDADVYFVANRRMFADKTAISSVAAQLASAKFVDNPESFGFEMAVLMILCDSVSAWSSSTQNYAVVRESISDLLSQQKNSGTPHRELLLEAAASLENLKRWSSSAVYLRRSDSTNGLQ